MNDRAESMNVARAGADRFVTYTGRAQDRFDPKPEDHTIEEIALSLSNLNRFGGYIECDYVVGEHSIHAAETILRMGGTALEALCGLLHDSSEGPFADVLGPLKVHMPDYRALESKYMFTVAEAFDVPFPMPDIVHSVDKRLAVTEGLALFPHVDPAHWLSKGVPIEGLAILDPRFTVEVELPRAPDWFRAAAASAGVDHGRLWPSGHVARLTSYGPLVRVAFIDLFRRLVEMRRAGEGVR